MYKFINNLTVSREKICLDLFDFPIRAFQEGEGIYYDHSLEKTANVLAHKYNLNKLENKMLGSQFWEEPDILQKLFRYLIEPKRNIFTFPIVLLSVPADLLNKKWKTVWQDFINKFSNEHGKRLFYTENFISAAAGAGLPVQDNEKLVFIYSTSRCTYGGVIFAGESYNLKTINQPMTEISRDKLINLICMVENELPNTLPINTKHLTDKITRKLKRGWQKEEIEEVFLAVPENLIEKYGFKLNDKRLIYIDEFDKCIIKGLDRIVKKCDKFK